MGHTMSWKLQVQLIGDTLWRDNCLRFATRDEALLYGLNLAEGERTVCNGRALASKDDVNSSWTMGVAINADSGVQYGHAEAAL